MSDSKIDLPCIEYRRTCGGMSGTDETYIYVRGSTLDECRKHFDEIRQQSTGENDTSRVNQMELRN